MKIFVLTGAFFSFFLLISMQAGQIEELRGKNRVVLIYAPAGATERLREQEELFRKSTTELKERDVVVLVVRDATDHPKAAERFRLAGSDFAVLLIGKDGGEKYRSAKVVPPATFFRLIDAMPMRREEMRERD